ncbi:MAG TPA: hypothetical protein VFE50_23360 [Cyclobacteriaceae bacterium]|nr:hypothetical protein [Cyclobacteriaceae bacterium]
MKKVALVVIFAILISTSGFSQADYAWVSVKTENGMGEKIDTITFVISDGYISQTKYVVADQDGQYLVGFEVSNSIDILWGFGKKATLPLIITPNDTIQVTIISAKNGILFGKRARTCANLMQMYEAENRPRVQAYETDYTTDPRDFVAFMDERLNDHLRFANNYCKSTKCTKTFVTWYLKSAYVSYYRNLADYCQSFQRKASQDPLLRNRFLRARNVIMTHIDLNDPTLEMSSGYYDLLRSIFSLYVTPDELRSMYYVKASGIILKKNVTEADSRVLRRIQAGTFDPDDIAVLTRLSQKYRKDVNNGMRDVLDPAIREKFAEINDADIRKVIIDYYKGIWSVI